MSRTTLLLRPQQDTWSCQKISPHTSAFHILPSNFRFHFSTFNPCPYHELVNLCPIPDIPLCSLSINPHRTRKWSLFILTASPVHMQVPNTPSTHPPYICQLHLPTLTTFLPHHISKCPGYLKGHHQSSCNYCMFPKPQCQGGPFQKWPPWTTKPNQHQLWDLGRLHHNPPFPYPSSVDPTPKTPDTGWDDKMYTEDNFHQCTWLSNIVRYSLQQQLVKPWHLAPFVYFQGFQFATKVAWMIEYHYKPLLSNALLGSIFFFSFPKHYIDEFFSTGDTANTSQLTTPSSLFDMMT